MDPVLKQRLVGATVLSALAVILIPMLFDSSGNRSDPQDFEIPAIPPSIAQNQPKSPETVADGESPPHPATSSAPVANSQLPEAISVPESPPRAAVPSIPAQGLSTEKVKPTKPHEENAKPLTAWVIQIGSFTRVENADQLRDQLRKAGFPAYVESGTKNGAALFRVRVGPELDPQRARAQRDKIARKFKVNAIVLPNAKGSDRSRERNTE
jgi:DedD protein